MKKYDIIAFTRDVLGSAEEKENGSIQFKLHGQQFILEPLEKEIKTKKEKKKRVTENFEEVEKKEEEKTNIRLIPEEYILENEITKQLKDSPIYQNALYDKRIIKKLSQELNESYKKTYDYQSLRNFLQKHLQNFYDYVDDNVIDDYFAYFVKAGQIRDREDDDYQIVESSLIPKKKKQKGGHGIFEALGMS